MEYLLALCLWITPRSSSQAAISYLNPRELPELYRERIARGYDATSPIDMEDGVPWT